MTTKILLSTIVVLSGCIDLCAQVSFGEQQIISTTDSFGAIESSDLDGDGDLDIISGDKDSNQTYALNWYENIDGQGLLEKHLIAEWINNNQKIFRSLSAADLDGDGDLDIVGATNNELYWFENMDGQGSFDIPTLLGPPVPPCDLCVSDLDNDGDLDIITGTCSPGYEGVVWYENISGEGDFSPGQIILDTFTNDLTSLAMNCFDLDEDDDVDILFSSNYSNDIVWFPNTGSGNFDSPQIITNTFGDIPDLLKLNDIDGDNDLDIIHFSRTSPNSIYTIFWCENINSSNDFGSKQIVHQGPDRFVGFPSDLDSDGDIDLIGMFPNQEGIFWYEYLGGQGYGSIQIITANEPAAVGTYTADIDGDNDPDLFTRSYPYPSYNLSWYENTSILTVNQNNLSNFSIYPIPVSEILNVKSNSKVELLKIFNSLGQIVLLKNYDNSIDLGELMQGLYYIEIVDENGEKEFKRIIRK